MSLLGSIFGDSSKKDEKETETEENLTNLFEKSANLPDKPNKIPVAKPLKRSEPTEVQEEDEAKKKKKKKRRKSKESDDKKEKSDEDGKVGENKDEGAENKEEAEKREKDPEERTVFVGNLPLETTTRKSLAALFKDCGPIVSTRIRSVPVKGIKLPPNRAGDQNLVKKVCVNINEVDSSLKNTIQGYVVFKNYESVSKALEKNSTKVDGFRIRVDKASPTVEPSRSVFCGNLPYGAEESSLHAHFVKGCALDDGDVEGVRIIRDKETFQCKGFGYVLFREKNMVPLALKLHESTYMKKQIRVLVCGKRFKNKRGENKPKYHEQSKEKVTIGAFRRIIAKQTKESVQINKRKRGDKKKVPVSKKASSLSKRAAINKKVDQRVKKLQKRISKGMGKTRR